MTPTDIYNSLSAKLIQTTSKCTAIYRYTGIQTCTNMCIKHVLINIGGGICCFVHVCRSMNKHINTLEYAHNTGVRSYTKI